VLYAFVIRWADWALQKYQRGVLIEDLEYEKRRVHEMLFVICAIWFGVYDYRGLRKTSWLLRKRHLAEAEHVIVVTLVVSVLQRFVDAEDTSLNHRMHWNQCQHVKLSKTRLRHEINVFTDSWNRFEYFPEAYCLKIWEVAMKTDTQSQISWNVSWLL